MGIDVVRSKMVISSFSDVASMTQIGIRQMIASTPRQAWCPATRQGCRAAHTSDCSFIGLPMIRIAAESANTITMSSTEIADA